MTPSIQDDTIISSGLDSAQLRWRLAERADPGDWPIPEDGFAIDEIFIHRAEVATVIGEVAMIAEHEITMRRHHGLGIGAHILVLLGQVWFVQAAFVDEEHAILDPDPIAGDGDHALDVALRGIARIAEYDDIAARNRLQLVNELVDEDPLLVLERGHHAGPFDLDRLIQEDDEERRNRQRDEHVAQPARKQGMRTLRPHLESGRIVVWV